MLLSSRYCKSEAKRYDRPDAIVAVGGGSVIDKAKIIAKDKKLPCIAVPTTAAGASCTSHSVVWGETKENVDTPLPIVILPEFEVKLSKEALEATMWDCYAHIIESTWSPNSTRESKFNSQMAMAMLNLFLKNHKMLTLIKAGNWAGKAIEITKTNIIHELSYPLTLKGMSHGLAIKEVICRNK